MITKETVPSSPIGVQWEFQPRSVALDDSTVRTAALDVWSLPLEATMSYGGAVSDFVRTLANRTQLVFRSVESAVGQGDRWDLVHRAQMSETLNTLLPAYVVFEGVKILASQLPAFEKEIFRETDTTAVLPVGSDLIFLKELLLRTRLQLSLDLDHLPTSADERTRIFEIVFKDKLRVSEIRLQPTAGNLAMWQDLVFDYGAAAAVLLKWNEATTPWSQVKASVTSVQALRTGIQPSVSVVSAAVTRQSISALDKAFADIFPQLRLLVPTANLKEIWTDFLAALGEEGAREWEPYGQLRLWPMFLKMHASDFPEWIELAQIEWARFSAEFHPADEAAEHVRLMNKELKVNPSLQTVRTRDALIAICRNRHIAQSELREQILDWMSAALIDEISEAPKMSEEALIHHVMGVRAPDGSPPTREEWLAILKKIISDGMILTPPI